MAMREIKLEKTLTTITDDPSEEGFVVLMDTIEYEGLWWLVPRWLEHETTRDRIPELLVRPTARAFEEASDPRFRFQIPGGVSRSALDGIPTDGYEIRLSGVADSRGPGGIH